MSAPTTSRPANFVAMPISPPPGGTKPPEGHGNREAHSDTALGTKQAGRHASSAAQTAPAAGPDSPPAIRPADAQGSHAGGGQTPGDQSRSDAQGRLVAGASEQDRAADSVTTSNDASLFDPALALAADVLDDIERVRIANENRLRQLTRSVEDSDGELRGFGLDESHPDVARLAALVELLAKAEHDATLTLQRVLRRHPLHAWIKAQRGIGEKQAARLLAAVGDPYWNAAQDRPRRGPAELWAYCGYVPGQRRVKGQRSNWSAAAKMRAYNIAESMLKAGNRDTYDKRKTATEGRQHAAACVRCGPSGKPAPAGSPWSDAHRHADALRVTAKAVLRDLWREAKRIHEGASA